MSTATVRNALRPLYWRTFRRDWYLKLERMRKFYAQFVSRGDLCFDVGANVGTRVEALARLGANVVAIEPQERCLEILRKNFGGRRNVTIVPSAVGSAAGEAEMLVNDKNNVVSTLSKEWIDAVVSSKRWSKDNWNRTVRVPVTTLDQLVAQHGRPTYCKIDVEGFELEVLRGLSANVPTISFEFTPERAAVGEACLARTAELGARFFNLEVGESFEFALPRWLGVGEMLEELRSRASLARPVTVDVYASVAPLPLSSPA